MITRVLVGAVLMGMLFSQIYPQEAKVYTDLKFVFFNI